MRFEGIGRYPVPERAMYLNLLEIKWLMLCYLELVGVLPGVRDQVQLGHHQHLAVVVVHSLQSSTVSYNYDII